MAMSARARFSQLYRGFLEKHRAVERCALTNNAYRRTYATKEAADDIDTPVKFTTSSANSETARFARERAYGDDSPMVQTISLMLSLAAFMIYFGILREENDLDEHLYDDLNEKLAELTKEAAKKGR